MEHFLTISIFLISQALCLVAAIVAYILAFTPKSQLLSIGHTKTLKMPDIVTKKCNQNTILFNIYKIMFIQYNDYDLLKEFKFNFNLNSSIIKFILILMVYFNFCNISLIHNRIRNVSTSSQRSILKNIFSRNS